MKIDVSKTKMPWVHWSRPLGAKISLGLVGSLNLFLVPLLYVAIFRARRTHANIVGE